MKTQFLILILLTFTLLKTNGQEIKKGSYAFTETVPKSFSNHKIFGDKINDINDENIKYGHDIRVIKIDGDTVYYKYWIFNNDSISNIYNGLNKDKVFIMLKGEFNDLTRPIYNRFKGTTVGAYSIPFRLRGKGDNFDFESSLSLQANMIFGWGSKYKENSWFDGSFGIGLTKVNLTEKNSDIEKNRSASAFTFSIGGVVKPSPMINGGIFIGWDFLGANDRDVNWIYNNKTWIGLGINISLNEIKTDNTKTKE